VSTQVVSLRKFQSNHPDTATIVKLMVDDISYFSENDVFIKDGLADLHSITSTVVNGRGFPSLRTTLYGGIEIMVHIAHKLAVGPPLPSILIAPLFNALSKLRNSCGQTQHHYSESHRHSRGLPVVGDGSRRRPPDGSTSLGSSRILVLGCGSRRSIQSNSPTSASKAFFSLVFTTSCSSFLAFSVSPSLSSRYLLWSATGLLRRN
jgi:hypothetical protein